MSAGRIIRVLIVDDSAVVRKILADALASEPDLEVAGTAPDPYVARDLILQLNPDVITLDIEMPRMDGLTFLQKLMHFHPMPAVIISSLAQPSCQAAVRALELGAVEVLAKPSGPASVGDLRHTLAAKVRAAAMARPRPRSLPQPPPRISASYNPNLIVAIGASTGGTGAISTILRALPKASPPVVVVQHIPAVFSRAFANRLNEFCEIDVKEAEDGDRLRPGLALIAPGDLHMLLRRTSAGYSVSLNTGPPICYQRPSADVLFCSVAEAARSQAVGVLLTGMGSDGARGLLKMREAGARTIAQDEATCVVFGMPREAIQLGAAGQVLPLGRIAEAIVSPRPNPAQNLAVGCAP